MSPASALIIGVGGLGSASAYALAELGWSHLMLVDPDTVEISNLHRQWLYEEEDVGVLKVHCAEKKLKKFFPDIHIATSAEAFSFEGMEHFLKNFSIVLDGLDRMEKKFQLNDLCLRAGVPLVHGGASGFKGQAFLIQPGKTACLRCFFPETPPEALFPSCERTGIFSCTVAILGLWQAKLADYWKKTRKSFGVWVDGWRGNQRSFSLVRNPECPLCRDA